VLSYFPKRRETRWPKGEDDESINSKMKPVQIHSAPYMVKPQRVTSFPMEHIRQRRVPLLVDSFVNNVASLFAVGQEPFSMTSDPQKRES